MVHEVNPVLTLIFIVEFKDLQVAQMGKEPRKVTRRDLPQMQDTQRREFDRCARQRVCPWADVAGDPKAGQSWHLGKLNDGFDVEKA